MRRIFIIILFNFCIILLSHTQTTFSKVYNIINGNEYGSWVIPSVKKVLILGRGICNPLSSNSVKCTYFLSIEGELINYDTFTDNSFVMAPSFATSIQNDTIFVFGTDYRSFPYKFIVYKTNIERDSLGKIVYSDFNFEVFAQSIIVKDEHIYLYGTINNNVGKRSLMLLKLDKNGKLIKDERFPEIIYPNVENLCTSMVETSDGNMAILSLYALNHNFDKYIVVCKFDKDLNTIWHKTLPKSSRKGEVNFWPCMTATNDGGLVISNEMDLSDSIYYNPDKWLGKTGIRVALIKLDVDGKIVWADTLTTAKYSGSIVDGPSRIIDQLFTASNGDILCIGEWYCFYCKPKHKAWLARYSPDGKLKWEHYYNDLIYGQGGYGSFFTDAKEADNGDIICTGMVEDGEGEWNNSGYTWLLRLDSMGCYTPGCLTGDTLTEVFTTATEEIIINISGKVMVYPNPAQDVINISIPEGFEAEKAEIFDVLGKRVMMLDQEYADIDISHLEAGLYFVVVKNKSVRMLNGKFVKGR
jgi:hypothetical protein